MAGLEHGSSFIMSDDSCLDIRGSSDFPTTSGRQNNPVLDGTKEKAYEGTGPGSSTKKSQAHIHVPMCTQTQRYKAN